MFPLSCFNFHSEFHVISSASGMNTISSISLLCFLCLISLLCLCFFTRFALSSQAGRKFCVEQNRTSATNVNNSKNLTTLVTGGTDGLGRAASILLAQRGYRVFAGSRNAERRAALEKTARERKLPLEAIDLDVTDDDSVSRAVVEIERRAGPVEVLVNNAGV